MNVPSVSVVQDFRLKETFIKNNSQMNYYKRNVSIIQW